MKKRLILIALLATATSTYAANFGTPGTAAKPAAAPAISTAPVTAVTPPISLGPQVADIFRIVKPDGATVIQQGSMTSNTASVATINVSEKDSFLIAGGMCAFNVKYDEISSAAATGTTNRLYSNDRLIAQNTKIDLVPGVIRSIWTQPYLTPGMNTVRVVVNADGAAPSTKWVRINVDGTCGAVVHPPVVTTPPPAPPKPPVVTTPPPAPVVTFKPGSAEWNNLNNAWGYSNYGTTQLKGKGYARYDELAKLNSYLTVVINAKSVERGAYNSLMTAWNTFVTDPAFKAAMVAAVASTSNHK
jgi:hypothetical protein